MSKYYRKHIQKALFPAVSKTKILFSKPYSESPFHAYIKGFINIKFSHRNNEKEWLQSGEK